MNNPPRFATLSKYPPYRSGHAKQALWNNIALALLTETEQHQVTYCGVSPDPEDDAGPGVIVHQVSEIRGNNRVPDGHLLRAVAAELYRVALGNDIDVLNTYYIDPHAAIANRVADALALAQCHLTYASLQPLGPRLSRCCCRFAGAGGTAARPLRAGAGRCPFRPVCAVPRD